MSSFGLLPVSKPRRRFLDDEEDFAPSFTEPSRRMPNDDYAAEVTALDPAARLNLGDTLRRINSPETAIEAENAPAPRGIYTPQPDFPEERRRRMITDPTTRDGALGVTEAERTTLNAPVPENKLVPYDPHAQRGGFLGTLKNIGRGALLSMSQADPRLGVGGGLGAALVGGIAGGASPKALEWADYKTRRLPEFQHQQAIAAQDASAREGISRRIGERTGYDPNTGQETPETRRQRMTDERLRTADAQRNEDRDIMADDRRRRDREQVAATAVQRAALMKQPVPNAAVKGTSLEALGGQIPPDRPGTGEKGSDWERNVDATGKVYYVNKLTGQKREIEGLTAHVPADPNAVTETDDVFGFPEGSQTPAQYEQEKQRAMSAIDGQISRGDIEPDEGAKMKLSWANSNPPPRPVKVGSRRARTQGGSNTQSGNRVSLDSAKQQARTAIEGITDPQQKARAMKIYEEEFKDKY